MDKNRLLTRLKSHRDELDQLIRDVGGKEHAEELFDADAIDGVIQGAFSDIVSSLEKHDTKEALRRARKWAKDKWVKTT